MFGLLAARSRINHTSKNRSDPYWSGVSTLLHFDELNGSTTFADKAGNAWSAAGTAQTSNGDLLLDGAGSYISTPYSDVFDFGGYDFTIEAFINPASVAAGVYGSICSKRSTATNGWSFECGTNDAPGAIRFRGNFGTNWSDFWVLASNVVTAGVKQHVAVCRHGDTLLMFVGGILVASSTVSGGVLNSFSPFRIGNASDTGENYFNGRIGEVRITKGVARYVSNFVPPTEPFLDGPVQQSYLDAYFAASGTPVFAFEFDNNLSDSSGNGYNASPGGTIVYTADDPAPGGGNCVNTTGSQSGNMPTSAIVTGNNAFTVIGVMKVSFGGWGNNILWMGGQDDFGSGTRAFSITCFGSSTAPKLGIDFARSTFQVAIDPKYVGQWIVVFADYIPGTGVRIHFAGLGDTAVTLAGSAAKTLNMTVSNNALFHWNNIRRFIGKAAFCGMKAGTLTSKDRQMFLNMWRKPKKAWRLYITANNGGDYHQALEVEFRTSVGGASIAKLGIPFASSSYTGGYSPYFAFDGDKTKTAVPDEWASAAGTGSVPGFIGYICPDDAQVNEVAFWNRVGSSGSVTSAPKDFIVQSSIDTTNGIDGTWVDEWTVAGQTGWTAGELRTFARP